MPPSQFLIYHNPDQQWNQRTHCIVVVYPQPFHRCNEQWWNLFAPPQLCRNRRMNPILLNHWKIIAAFCSRLASTKWTHTFSPFPCIAQLFHHFKIAQHKVKTCCTLLCLWPVMFILQIRLCTPVVHACLLFNYAFQSCMPMFILHIIKLSTPESYTLGWNVTVRECYEAQKLNRNVYRWKWLLCCTTYASLTGMTDSVTISPATWGRIL